MSGLESLLLGALADGLELDLQVSVDNNRCCTGCCLCATNHSTISFNQVNKETGQKKQLDIPLDLSVLQSDNGTWNPEKVVKKTLTAPNHCLSGWKDKAIKNQRQETIEKIYQLFITKSNRYIVALAEPIIGWNIRKHYQQGKAVKVKQIIEMANYVGNLRMYAPMLRTLVKNRQSIGKKSVSLTKKSPNEKQAIQIANKILKKIVKKPTVLSTYPGYSINLLRSDLNKLSLAKKKLSGQLENKSPQYILNQIEARRLEQFLELIVS